MFLQKTKTVMLFILKLMIEKMLPRLSPHWYLNISLLSKSNLSGLSTLN